MSFATEIAAGLVAGIVFSFSAWLISLYMQHKAMWTEHRRRHKARSRR